MPKSKPINKYVLTIEDSRKAVLIDGLMNHYGLMDNYNRLKRDSYTTNWKKGKGNHEYEDKIFTFTELKKIKIRLHLNTPHYIEKKGDREIHRPIKDKESLEIIITKKRGGSLSKEEIRDAIYQIERETGERGILQSPI